MVKTLSTSGQAEAPNRPFCVEYYWENWRQCMAGVKREDRPHLLSSGVSQFSQSPVLNEAAMGLLRYSISSGQLSRYHLNDRCAAQIAEILCLYLERDDLTAENIVYCYGSTDALDMLFEYCRMEGIRQGAIPLASYYGYELAILGNGLHIDHYYGEGVASSSGQVREKKPKERRFLLRNVPEGISGAQNIEPPSHLSDTECDFVIVDTTCQTMDVAGARTRTELRKVANERDLINSCLLMTLSKDLGLPGLRSGIVITRDQKLLSFLKKRVEQRYVQVGPLSCYAMLFYAYCLAVESGVAKEHAGLAPLLDEMALFESGRPIFEREATEIFARQREVIRTNFVTLQDKLTDIFENLEAFRSGFTCFPNLRFLSPTPERTLAFSKHLSERSKVWVNTMHAFGGTQRAWQEIYPERIGLRINLSWENNFADYLSRLRQGLDSWSDASS
ncbi:aminotransferase class I/II-fold pyridoxal phosphate-dependent enzyme [Roseibium sp. SCP14]|uniref:aminotransferase class I/II-fold pyridoxal phosphate-dependent enzyme n=1 Tax=Roseibium sp. SCP14 TaxID=3141375 RepID=UPI0033391429